jgi:hypothetical protein
MTEKPPREKRTKEKQAGEKQAREELPEKGSHDKQPCES